MIDRSSSVGAPEGSGDIARIDSVSFVCLTSANFDTFSSTPTSFEDSHDGIELGGPSYSTSHAPAQVFEHPCAGIRKVRWSSQ